jgi:preprotein translocase subunit SecD
MMIKFVRFNIYLCLGLGLIFLATGCQSSKKKKDVTTLELHLEVNKDGAEDNVTVPIFRDQPVYVNVDKEFFLDTPDISEAKVVDDLGGFKLRLQFNWRGTLILNSVTSANLGKRIGVVCHFGKNRWLAAPVIRRQITDGVLEFTPDASREEADEIAKGLNTAAAKLKKEDKF